MHGGAVLHLATMIRTELLPITSSDGAEVTASLFQPDAARAAVVCLPALGVPASYYESLGRALADRGITAVTVDLRGNGRSSVRPRRGVDFGYAVLVRDAQEAVRSLRERFGLPTHVLGHSLGGHVGALLAGVQPRSLDGLILVACGTPYWRRFPAAIGLRVLALAGLAPLAGRLLGCFPGHLIGFGGREAAQLMREWGRLARRGGFEIAGMDAGRALADARVRTLVVSIDGDRMAPTSAVDHLVGKLPQVPLQRVHITRTAGDPRRLDHFRWARSPQAVLDVVVPWIDASTSRDAIRAPSNGCPEP